MCRKTGWDDKECHHYTIVVIAFSEQLFIYYIIYESTVQLQLFEKYNSNNIQVKGNTDWLKGSYPTDLLKPRPTCDDMKYFSVELGKVSERYALSHCSFARYLFPIRVHTTAASWQGSLAVMVHKEGSQPDHH